LAAIKNVITCNTESDNGDISFAYTTLIGLGRFYRKAPCERHPAVLGLICMPQLTLLSCRRKSRRCRVF